MREELGAFLAQWIRERGKEVSIEQALREVHEELNQLRTELGHNANRSAAYRHRMLHTR